MAESLLERGVGLQAPGEPTEAALRTDQASSTSTIAHDDGFVEQRLAGWRQKEFRIGDLDTQSLSCRLLIQPAVPAAFASQGGEWRSLRRRPSFQDDTDVYIRCLALNQTKTEVKYGIYRPLNCQIFYNPVRDSVEVMNMMDVPIRIDGVPADEEHQPGQIIIEPFAHQPLAPGAWAWSSLHGECAFQARIFHRNYSLELMRPHVPEIAGSKRGRSAEHLESLGVFEESTLIKRVNSLADASDQQIIRILTGVDDCRILRMTKVGDTGSATVFNAKHPKLSNEVIVVKVLNPKSYSNAVHCGRAWLREYDAHRKVQSVRAFVLSYLQILRTI